MKDMYDPMTGELLQPSEPVSGQTEEELNFDPMTGQPIKKEAGQSGQPEDRFDPMTGQPIKKEAGQQEEELNFDPMTGQPIKKKSGQQEERFDPMTGQPQGGFDPMTGKPLTQTGFDPMTGQPVYGTSVPGSKKKAGKVPVIAAAAAGIVVVAGVLVGCVASGAFLSKPNKVLLATKRTLSDRPQFVKDLGLDSAADMLKSGYYRLAVNVDIEDGSAKGTFVSTKSEKQLYVDIKPYGNPSIEIRSSLTDSQWKVYVPELSPDVYTLNYKEDGDGYIVDLLEDNDIRYEDLSNALSTLYSQEEQEKNTKELSDALIKQIKGLDWKKEETRDFRINGKSRKAKGYGVTVTADDAEDMLDIIDDYLNENIETDVPGLKDSMDELYDAFRDMPDVDFIFYIYKNRLAAVCMEIDRYGECELVFKGGDFRMQNMELEVDDGSYSETMELVGKTNGDRETYELIANGRTFLEMEYNSKSGRYELRGNSDEIIEGEIQKERGKVGASIEMGDEFSAEFVLTKDAVLEKLPDREVDVMDMSEEDWMSLGEIGDYI